MWLAARYCLSESRSPKRLLARPRKSNLPDKAFPTENATEGAHIDVENKIKLPVFH